MCETTRYENTESASIYLFPSLHVETTVHCFVAEQSWAYPSRFIFVFFFGEELMTISEIFKSEKHVGARTSLSRTSHEFEC